MSNKNQTTDNQVPRRNDLNRNTKEELLIRTAIREVEKLPANEKLTEAVMKMTEAFNLVADFVDGPENQENRERKVCLMRNTSDKMKVYLIRRDELYHAYAAQTKNDAIDKYLEEQADHYTAVEEIPESEWDKEQIEIYEDNDFSKKPFLVSIRQVIDGTDPHLIFTNEIDF